MPGEYKEKAFETVIEEHLLAKAGYASAVVFPRKADQLVTSFNGDGLDDIIGRASGNWYAAISTGTAAALACVSAAIDWAEPSSPSSV